MKVPAEIFRAYDIRGIAGRTLTPEVVRAVGRALGSMAREFAVGRDGRDSGPGLVDALCEGLQASGANVVDIGMAPTPVVYFAAHHLGRPSADARSGDIDPPAASVMITGSHNPPEDNGFKLMFGTETLHGAQIAARLEHVRGERVPQHVRVDSRRRSLPLRPFVDALLHGARADA